MSTIVYKNFLGNLTRYPLGDTASGNAIYQSSWGYANFKNPGQISFMDAPTDISGGIVTDAIIDGKSRVESGILYVYAIGHTGRLYKIQVNNPTIPTPQYDVVTLITTLTTATSFTMGGTLEIFGSTELLYIGHDNGVTAVNFDGTGETAIGYINQWITGVPRQGIIFRGNLVYSNGSNLAFITPEGNVSNFSQITNFVGLNPVDTNDYVIKDVDIDSTGTKLIVVSSNVPNQSLLSTTPNINATYGAVSVIAKWDGTSPQLNSLISIPSFAQTASVAFGQYEYVFGYDLTGGIMSTLVGGFKKLLTNIFSQSPTPNASTSNGNIVGWFAPEYSFSTGKLVASLFLYGSLDQTWPENGFYRQIQVQSSLASGDILRVPWTSIISNFQFGGSTSGYGSNVVGLGRSYFSTVEYNGVTSAYKLYSYYDVPVGTNVCSGVYETQASLATGGQYTPTQVRIYINPATGKEIFSVQPIGVDGNVLASGSKTFSSIATGTTVLSYAPGSSATTALGMRIVNSSASGTPVISKIEVDA